jgi:hygromycin-B 4-O-kinase
MSAMMGDVVGIDEVGKFLTERYGGASAEVAELGSGEWSRAFSFRLGDEQLVARFGQHGEDFEKDRSAMAFAGPDLPIPKVLEVGEALGGAYAISERHAGTFLEALDAAGWRRVLPALLCALDAMRELPVPTDSPVEWPANPQSEPVSWQEWLLRTLEDRPGGRVAGWREGIAASAEIAGIFGSAERELTRCLPVCPEIRHVVHSDLINRNVFVSTDATRLEAVFDWGGAFRGDFLYEVACLSFWAPWYPALDALDLPARVWDHYDDIGLVVPSMDERLYCYGLHIGLAHLAYATFTGRDDHRVAIVERTRQVLDAVTR